MDSIEENRSGGAAVGGTIDEPKHINSFQECKDLLSACEEKFESNTKSIFYENANRKRLIAKMEEFSKLAPATEASHKEFNEQTQSNAKDCKLLLIGIGAKIKHSEGLGTLNRWQSTHLDVLKIMQRSVKSSYSQAQHNLLNLKDTTKENISLLKEKLMFTEEDLEQSKNRIKRLKEERPKLRAEKKRLKSKYKKFSADFKVGPQKPRDPPPEDGADTE